LGSSKYVSLANILNGVSKAIESTTFGNRVNGKLDEFWMKADDLKAPFPE